MRDQETALTLCHGCPKLCRYSCPVADAEQNEATTPWGKMTTMKLVDEGRLPMNRETMALAYKCLNCRLSEEVCELDNPVSSVLDAHRVRAFQAGLAPVAVHQYCGKFQKQNNPFGQNLTAKLGKLFPQKMGEKKSKVYFPGCTEIRWSPDSIEKTFSLFGRLKINDVSLFSDPIQCCGYPLFAAGDWENFREIAEVMANTFRDTSLVMSGSPACLYTMETLYRAAGFPAHAKFQHLVEFLEPAILKTNEAGRGHRKKDGPVVAYHDPCYLSRYRNVTDTPRSILEKVDGRPPKEFSRNRQNSYCCGAGGLLPVSSPETADKITSNRLEEFRNTGADILVSACPTCVHRFQKVTPPKGSGAGPQREKRRRIIVKNLTDYVEEALNGKG